MDDRALVRRMLGGDEGAFDEFFEAYFDRVFRFARRRTRRDDEAEDAAQATLVQAVRKLDGWRGEAALFTWLCSICRRELTARWSLNDRQPVLREDEPGVRAVLEQIATDAEGPDQQLHRREVAALVHLTLDYLPARYGDLLEWKYIEGHSVSDIATRLGSTPKAVESMLTRARQAFREGFDELTRGEAS